MKYRKLGGSGLEVSAVSMGCWGIAGGSTWGPQKESDAINAIHAACEAGINLFDTAEEYGDGYSEELLGRALVNRRKDVIIASKVSRSHLRPKDLRKACQDSLGRLQTDYLDLYYIHWPNWEVPIEDTFAAMEALKKEGKIRAIGCSNFGKRDLTDLLKIGRVEVNQLPYSLIWRAIEFEVHPICQKNNISIVCYTPLAQGLLTGKYNSPDEVPEGRARTRHFSGDRPKARHGERGVEEKTFEVLGKIKKICREINVPMADVALAWVLTRAGVASVIAGARNPEQVSINAKAAELKLSSNILKRLTLATEELKEKLGPNPDMWQSDSRMR